MIFNESGGTSLNFKVVGGTSAPASPKENMIWINTSVTVSGWEFSAIQPTGETGKVWIVTGASGTATFNALKKNAITICPISAKQYVSGAWVDKTAKSYQDGEWVEWCDVIPLTEEYWTPDLIYGGTCDFRDGKAHLTKPYNAGYGTGVYLVTTDPWDLSKYSTLRIQCSCTYEMSVCIDNNASGWDGGEIVSKTIPAKATEQEYTLDISQVSSGYIRINLQGNANTDAGTGTVSAVRLYT